MTTTPTPAELVEWLTAPSRNSHFHINRIAKFAAVQISRDQETIAALVEALKTIRNFAEPHRKASTYTVEHMQGVVDAMKARASAALRQAGEH